MKVQPLSIIAFNLNGTEETRVLAHSHWIDRFSHTDIVLLQETRSIAADPLHGTLSDTHVCTSYCDPLSNGKAGHGLAVYVKADVAKHYHYKPRRLSSYIMWAELTVGAASIVIGNVYVPHAPEIRDQVYDTLHQDITTYQQEGNSIICCGDFNAHVGNLEDRQHDPFGHPITEICTRGIFDYPINASGEALVGLCVHTGCVLCTGRGPRGSQSTVVEASFKRPVNGRIAQTRPDHCMLSAHGILWVTDHSVLSDMLGSDHRPLFLAIEIPCHTPAIDLPSPLPTPLMRVIWDKEKMDAYVDAITDHPEVVQMLQETTQAASDPLKLSEAPNLLHSTLLRAATIAGMRVVKGRDQRQRHHRPWFDNECRTANRLARGNRPTQEQLQELRRLYQRKKRQYAGKQYSRFRAICKEDPTYFWKAARRNTRRSPPPVPTMQEISSHFMGVFQGPGFTGVPLAPPSPQEAEEVFSDEVINQAFKSLKKRSSPGMPGIPAGAFGPPAIRSIVQQILKAVYMLGAEPASMALALLNPIHKKGDMAEPKNYRPVVVSSVLHKLYALCMGCHVWGHIDTQEDDIFPRQAGFVPQRSTLHNMFMLQHLAHHHWRIKRPLYVALLDVSAAYDTTRHDKMVETLLQQGFPAHLVRGIASMYVDLQYNVAVNGEFHNEAFPVGIGVKQGCPLSPTLYNLYVQPLSPALARLGLGPRLPGVQGTHPDFHYADDAVLAEPTVRGLQDLLTHSETWLTHHGLSLGVPKCVALVLGTAHPPQHPQSVPLTIGDKQIPHVPLNGAARYLGLMFDTLARAETMAAHRANCFISSYYAATGAMRVAPGFPCAIPTFLKLLHTVVEPAGLYGCELWGLLSVKGILGGGWCIEKFYALEDPLEVHRCNAMKRWLKLPKPTPKLCLLHELGCEPLVHEFTRRSLRFYNTLAGLPDSSVYKGALRESVADGLSTNRPAPNFLAALYRALELFMPRALVRRFRALQQIDPMELDIVLASKYKEYTTRLSQCFRGEGAKIGLYFREVAQHELGVVPRYYSCHLAHGVLVRFLRFRVGSHHLRVNTGRWETRGGQPLEREDRTCLRCQDSLTVDDEEHCLLRCSYPDLADFRRDILPDLATYGDRLANSAEFWRVLESVTDTGLLKNALHYVAACVRISWRCYQAGGCDRPVEQRAILAALPDDLDPVIQNLRYYYDDFDSTSGSDDGEIVPN